jgi:thymidylate synthase
MFCQFYVHLEKEPGARRRLSCVMYQRSADLGLGIPFNIASYALLTHMVAKVTDTDAHELIMQLGDAHVYRDHVDALGQQLKREPRPFPLLKWKRDDIPDIDSFEYDDFVVDGYNPHPKLAMKMSVRVHNLCSALTALADRAIFRSDENCTRTGHGGC